MTTGEKKSGHGRRGQRRSGSEASAEEGVSVAAEPRLPVLLLSKIDLLMPLAPDLGGRKHPSRAALVTKRGLTRSMRSTTRHARDTSHSTACRYHRQPSC